MASLIKGVKTFKTKQRKKSEKGKTTDFITINKYSIECYTNKFEKLDETGDWLPRKILIIKPDLISKVS